jgi:DNA-binding GntR family transcriptional regulator
MSDNLPPLVLAERAEFSPPPSSSGRAAPRQERPRRRHADVYCELRDAIVSGRFQPNERLVESELADIFGAGRTAIRAALATLDQEGLVVRERHRGARVRLISGPDAIEIEQVRNALERMVARLAGARATDDDLADLRRMMGAMSERVREGDSVGYSALNARFHQRIWAIADHELATKLLGTLKSQSIRFQYRTMLRPGRTEESLREHEAIVDALARRDPDRCEAAMSEHLRHVVATLQWAIETQSRPSPWLPG